MLIERTNSFIGRNIHSFRLEKNFRMYFNRTFANSSPGLYPGKWKGQVRFMIRNKTEKYRLELSWAEFRLLIAAMIHFRNRVAQDGLPTEDVNELLIKLMR